MVLCIYLALVLSLVGAMLILYGFSCLSKGYAIPGSILITLAVWVIIIPAIIPIDEKVIEKEYISTEIMEESTTFNRPMKVKVIETTYSFWSYSYYKGNTKFEISEVE